AFAELRAHSPSHQRRRARSLRSGRLSARPRDGIGPVNVAELAGVGRETAERFAELGIRTAEDLLNHFPHRYEDLRYPTPAAQLGASGGPEGPEENAVATIVNVRERRARHLAI